MRLARTAEHDPANLVVEMRRRAVITTTDMKPQDTVAGAGDYCQVVVVASSQLATVCDAVVLTETVLRSATRSDVRL